jgi:hypothetical protein
MQGMQSLELIVEYRISRFILSSDIFNATTRKIRFCSPRLPAKAVSLRNRLQIGQKSGSFSTDFQSVPEIALLARGQPPPNEGTKKAETV